MSTYNNNNGGSRVPTGISFRNIDGVLDGVYTANGPGTPLSATTNQSLTPPPAIFLIYPDNYPENTQAVAASAFSWNQENVDAAGSDGTPTIDILSNVTFQDVAEPGTLENYIYVYVQFDSNFQVPTEYQSQTYTIELDLQGKAQLPLLTGRYVNISLVNDFADTVDVDTSKNVYNSGIKSMTSSPVLQAMWDQAFHNKTPLKYDGGVVFTPAEEDALNQPVRVFDSREHHASEDYQHPDTWGDPGYGLSSGQGMQVGRRKDVIHLGFNCPEPGVPIKIGTFKLKLNQDIYGTSSLNNLHAESGTNSLLEQMNMGQRNRSGLVNGWFSKFTGYAITQERFLFNSSSSFILNPDYSEFTPAAPLGHITTFREGFLNDGSGTYGNFTSSNNTGVTIDDPNFDGPFALTDTPRFFSTYIRDGLRNDAEIITTWGTGDDLGSVFVSGMSGALHGPEIMSYQNSGGQPLTAEDYIEGVLDVMQIDYNSANLLHVAKSILWWQYSLYKALDLYCWSMFPAFCMHDTPRYYQTTDITRIVNIPLNPNGGSLSIGGSGNYTITKWAQNGWEDQAFTDNDVIEAWYDINNDPEFGKEILTETTTYLHNYVREVEFDIFYTDNEYAAVQIPVDAGEVDENGTPFKGFNPETGEAGEGITTMQEDGPPLIEGYTFNLTTNICWNYFPHAEIINLGGFASKTLLDQSEFGRSGKSLSRIKTFTNRSQPTTGARDRYEIKEINLNLGSALGSARENIIPPGGIPRGQSDATVSVVGDPGAKFNITFKETQTIELDGDNPRAAGSADPTEAILNGGFYESIDFGKDNIHYIPTSGSITLLLPQVRRLSLTDGYKEFELKVAPVNTVSTPDPDPQPDPPPPPVPTVIRSSARRTGDRLTAGNTTVSTFTKTIYQYPNVSINTSVTKHDGSSFVTNYADTDIPHFAYEGKPLGKALGQVSDITFLRDNEKNISFEIRIQKSGTFSINQDFISQAFELNKCSYNNSTTINHQGDRTDIVVGMLVSGEGIPEGAIITSIPNRDSFTISSATTGGSKENQTLTLSFTSIDSSSILPNVLGNNDKVQFSNIVAHVGNGLSNTDANYATFAGRIKYIQFGERSQTFNIDLTKIFNHA